MDEEGFEIGEQPPRKTKEKKTKWVCKTCQKHFSTKGTRDNHVSQGLCLGKGYLCLRCWKLWKTPSELQRHQSAKNKCKLVQGCEFKRGGNQEIEQKILNFDNNDQ